MRTVTFSDLDLARRIHETCVPVWVNVSPTFHDCNGGSEERIWKAEPEVFATKNIVTYFATPDFRVFDYLSGYWHPRLFGKELEFVERVRREVFDPAGKPRPSAAEKLRRAHSERVKDLAALSEYFWKEVGWQAALGPDPVNGEHKHGDLCRGNLVEGFEHLRAVHRDFARREGDLTNLPRLSRLLEEYRYGNEFAEGKPEPLGREVRAAMRIR